MTAEKSFLSRIHGMFDSSTDSRFSGRFIENVLVEAAKEDIGVAKCLFKNSNSSDTWTTEYSFKVGGALRRADIALLDEALSPKALFEIKYDDNKNKKNSAQFKDYLSYSKKNNIAFICLTKNFLADKNHEKLEKSGSLVLFSTLSEKISSLRKKSGITTLLEDYMKNEGLAMLPLDEEAFRIFLIRLFCPIRGVKKNAGSPSKMSFDVPNSFSTVTNNMAIISKEMNHLIQSREPTIDYRPYPTYLMQYLGKGNSADDPEKHFVPSVGAKKTNANMVRAGGRLDIFARHVLKTSPRVDLSYGINFKVDATGKVQFSLWSEIWSRSLTDQEILNETDYLKDFRKLNDKKFLLRSFTQLAKKSLSSASKQDQLLTAAQIKSLLALGKAL